MIRSNRRFQNRAGYTLIHCLVLIAITPIILIAASTWVHQTLKMSAQFKHRRESHSAMTQLTNQIQDDVRSCKSLKFNADLNQIELAGRENQQVTFQIERSHVLKTSIVNGEVVGRERYRLSDEYFPEWDKSAMEEDSNHVTLNILRYPTAYHEAAPDSLDVPDPKLELVITAKANRWKRTISFGRETATKIGAEK